MQTKLAISETCLLISHNVSVYSYNEMRLMIGLDNAIKIRIT